MKNKLIQIGLLIGSSYIGNAQCVDQPVCVNNVTLTCTDISNQSINGSPCFHGQGVIPNSYNINNANFYVFEPGGTDSTQYCYQNINFQNGSKKAFAGEGNVIIYGNVSFDGQDTFVVHNGSSLLMQYPIANNGANTIVLEGTGSVKVGGMNNQVQYYAGDIIHTSGNTSNDIHVVACTNSIPLSIVIIEFKLYHNTLHWRTQGSEPVEIQIAENPKKPTFHTVYLTSSQEDSLDIHANGLYRLKVGNQYSDTIPYEVVDFNKSEPNKVYYFMGQFSKQSFNNPYQGYKIVK